MATKNIISASFRTLLHLQKHKISSLHTYKHQNKLPFQHYYQQKFGIVFKNKYSFAVQIRNPEQKKQQKLTPVQKLIVRISQLTEKDITNENLQNFYKTIHGSALSSPQITSATKYLMSILYKYNYPINQLLNSPIIKKIQYNQPFVQLQTIMYVISKNLASKQPNIQLINNLYLHSFNTLLPKVTDQTEKLKCEVLLYKNFGKHLISSGEKNKGWKILQNSIEKHRILILQQYKKMQKIIKIAQNQQSSVKKAQSEKQHEKLQINALKQNIRRLIQSMFQTTHYFYISKKQFISSTSSKQKQEAMVLICSLINQSMRIKTLVPGVQLYSKYYHRLKQISFELQYTYSLINKNQARVKQIKNQMKQFITSCLKDVSQSSNQIQLHREIALAAFSIKLHLTRMQANCTNDKIKQNLTQLGLKIIQTGKMQQNKMQKQLITKLLGEFLKKTIH